MLESMLFRLDFTGACPADARATYSNLHVQVAHIAQQGDESEFYAYNALFVKHFIGTCVPPNGCATVSVCTYACRSDSGCFRHQAP
jgi:hypothetical protein